jgi:hypothetical protein
MSVVFFWIYVKVFHVEYFNYERCKFKKNELMLKQLKKRTLTCPAAQKKHMAQRKKVNPFVDVNL